VSYWYILYPFGQSSGHLVYIFYGTLVLFVVIWYIFFRFGMMYDEKSGNPDAQKPTTYSYNASVVKIDIGMSSLVRFSNKNSFNLKNALAYIGTTTLALS
jgi:hypothetical protein